MSISAADAWVMRDTAKKVDTMLGEIQTSIGNLDTRSRSIPEFLEGPSAELLVGRMQRVVTIVNEKMTAITEFCKEIEKAAQSAEDADSNATQIGKSLEEAEQEVEKAEWGEVK